MINTYEVILMGVQELNIIEIFDCISKKLYISGIARQ